MEGNPINAGSSEIAEEAEGLGKRVAGMFPINVSIGERWVSAALGGALLALGLRTRSWFGWLLALAGGDLLLRGATGRSVIYRALDIDSFEAKQKLAEGAGKNRRFTVEKTLTVSAPAEEVFRFWRNLENLPRVMRHLKSVHAMDDKHSHWIAKAPAGMDIEWDAEITDERQDRKIAWSSAAGSIVESKGAVTFEPVQDGSATEIRVYLEYAPLGGKAGKAFAKLFGKDPSRMIEEDLRGFKSMIESGETALDRAGRS